MRLRARLGSRSPLADPDAADPCVSRQRPRRNPSAARAIALMWSGVVPQQPPRMLTKPLDAKSRQQRGGFVRAFVVLAERIGQTGVRIAADVALGQPRQLGEIRAHVARAERAVDADAERLRVANRHVERVERLARQRAPAAIGDRHRDRSAAAGRRCRRTHSRSRRARPWRRACRRSSRAEGCRCRRRSGPAPVSRRPRASRRTLSRETPGLLTSGEIDSVRLVGPIEPATNRGRSGVFAVHSSAAARASRAPSTVDVVDGVLERVVPLRDHGAAERVGLDDVGAGGEVFVMDRADDVRTRQDEHVAVPLQVARMIREPRRRGNPPRSACIAESSSPSRRRG